MIGQIAANFPSSLFNQIPRGLFNYGAGGVNAWRNICGGPNGGSALLAQLGAPTSVKDEFNAWYERTLIPSNAAYVDWNAGGWTVNTTPKNNAPQAVPESLLCHASHGRWLAAAGGEEGAWVSQFTGADQTAKITAAGADRCSKLVYDCVYKLCQLINDWKAGTTPTGTLDPSVAACFQCHGAVDPLDTENCAPEISGKMKCTDTCHQ